MNFQPTLNWCEGEIFEGKMSLLFGVILFMVAFAYYIWSSTPAAKAMFWPLLIISFISLGAGYYLMSTNQKRIPEYRKAFEENPGEFLQSERTRTTDFIKWYPITQKILFGLMVVGMICMLASHAPLVRSIGIGLMLLSLYGFVLDHFSEERADSYSSQLLEFALI